MGRRSIEYGQGRIDYGLRFADRETLEISVHPDRTVEVVAPFGADDEEVANKVRRRARWILRQQRYFDQFVPRTPSRRYVSGETHLYLGRQYRLKVVEDDRPGVKLTRGRIFIATPQPRDTSRNAALLLSWYRGRAHVKFAERFGTLFPSFARLGLPEPLLVIRPLTRRWGSLSANGHMTLNRDLIRAPTPCIDYVITHELCHLVHRDHGPAFYDLLERIMPDWETRKARLERMMV